VTTLLGKVVYERAYYSCSACGHGHFPTDEVFRIQRKQTPAAREVISLMGVLEPFDEGAEQVLPRMSGMCVSAATIRRTTEEVGADVAARRAAGEALGPEVQWGWNCDKTGRKVAYVELDATGVRQQGPHAERAEGRMSSVAAVLNPQPNSASKAHRRKPRMWEARYVSGLLSLNEIGQQLRSECRAVGIEAADVVVGLTDGGNGLEDCLLDAVGGLAKQIHFVLDFYHAAEHLQVFAKEFLTTDEARKQQVDAWCHTLKQRGGRTLYEELEHLDLKAASPHVREEHRRLLGYFGNNLHRMDYPEYVSRGWQIGSGAIESACKTVVGRRLKGGGMRWRESGTHEMCQLRALYRSEPSAWRNYWAPTTGI
jgi:hypothetical protein